MSVTVTGRVFWTEIKSLSDGRGNTVSAASAKLVLLAIGDSSDDFGENSWQSFETIAKKASMERRSIIRIVRALVFSGYLCLSGTTRDGTNCYSVVLDKLGNAPLRRAKTGRPKSSDSSAESGDSGAESGDIESPDPSYNHTTPAPTKRQKRGDIFDGMKHFAEVAEDRGVDAVEATLAELERGLNRNIPRHGVWQDLARWINKRRGVEPLDTWIVWYMKDPFNVKCAWNMTPEKIKNSWPAAFTVADVKPPRPAILDEDWSEAKYPPLTRWKK